jgi:hypothetical protein
MTRARRWLSGGALATLIALVAAQALPVPRTNPPVSGELVAAAPIAQILRRACYDCHSNQTVWPWYSAIAPVSWLVVHDVEEGRRELNFSTWAVYDAARRRKKLGESRQEMIEGEMPPWMYVLMHAEARLSPAERDMVLAWIDVELGRPATQ